MGRNSQTFLPGEPENEALWLCEPQSLGVAWGPHAQVMVLELQPSLRITGRKRGTKDLQQKVANQLIFPLLKGFPHSPISDFHLHRSNMDDVAWPTLDGKYSFKNLGALSPHAL